MNDKTKNDLAEYLGMTYGTLLNKLSGNSDFKVDELKKIRVFLNLSKDDIIEIFLS